MDYISDRSGIDLSFENISYTVKVEVPLDQCSLPWSKKYTDKHIIKNISGICKSAKVTAIIGTSGSGKTTLLNILSAKIKPSANGKLYANNQEYQQENFGDFANYVMQKDILMQTLTVRQTLEFVGGMKFGNNSSIKKERIERLVKRFKLQKCLDTLVGGDLVHGISGGEKKRTSIAFQLISDPQVILLDEPTSGLDSLTAYLVVGYLKELCQKQAKTVILAIHQPNAEIYSLFDSLLLLVQGKLIYQGSASNSQDYFSSNFGLKKLEFANPAEFFISIMHQQNQVNQNYFYMYFENYERVLQPQILQKIKNRNSQQIQQRYSSIPICYQLKQLLKRDAYNIKNHPILLRARFVQTLILATFIGGLYFHIDREYTDLTSWLRLSGFMFFICIHMFFVSIAVMVLTFPTEREVFLKEESSKLYGIFSYFLSRNLVEVIYTLFFTLMYCTILYLLVGLGQTLQQFLTFYLTAVALSWAGNALGLVVGTLIADKRSIALGISIPLAPMVLFAGFFKNLDSLPQWIGWVQYISPIKYAFTALIKNQILHQQFTLAFLFNFDLGLWDSILRLFQLGILFRMLSFLFLWWRKTQLE